VPTFDVVSEVDMQEVRNAVHQASRELENRFDFKGTKARFDFDGEQVTMRAPDEFQLRQMYDILTGRLASRKVTVRALQLEPPQVNVGEASQIVKVRQGIDSDLARELVKLIKQSKLKVQVAVQGDQLRVSGKKRDDLQQAIGLLKEADVDRPLQYTNFRD
jgi:uncharacterized protein YajQ (UPF0234 family)